MFRRGAFHERTDILVVIAAACVAIVGFAAMQFARILQPQNVLREPLRDLGAFLVITVVLAVIFELFARRSMLAEFMDSARLSDAIGASGIVGVSHTWYRDIPWQQIFKAAAQIDMLVTFSEKWRWAFTDELRHFARRGRGGIRIVLPDPDDPTVVAALAQRFETTVQEVTRRIREAREEFERLFSEEGGEHFRWSIWYLPRTPLYTCYRFDDICILSLYRHRRRGEVPTLILKRGGTLFDFACEDFHSFLRGPSPSAKLVAGHFKDVPSGETSPPQIPITDPIIRPGTEQRADQTGA
jgi:hypothetical protein